MGTTGHLMMMSLSWSLSILLYLSGHFIMVVLVNIIVTIEVQCLLRDLFLIDYFMNWNSILVLSSLIINDQIFLQ